LGLADENVDTAVGVALEYLICWWNIKSGLWKA